MLEGKQRELYTAFYESTTETADLGKKESVLVGLAAAMALNCLPCMNYYMKLCRDEGIGKKTIESVLAKVMAVAAGQKRLQAQEVVEKYSVAFYNES